MDIKIDTYGKILKGDHLGWHVLIIDDTNGKTGGAYVIVSENKDGSGKKYDDWLETINDLEQYFEESKWEIQWDV